MTLDEVLADREGPGRDNLLAALTFAVRPSEVGFLYEFCERTSFRRSSTPVRRAVRCRDQDVLELVREGMTPAEICRDIDPDLLPDDVRACVQYAVDLVVLEDVCLAETA